MRCINNKICRTLYFARDKTDSDLDVLCLELSLELGILDGLLNIDIQGLRPFSQTANILISWLFSCWDPCSVTFPGRI